MLNCLGCGEPFEPLRSNQRRCRPRCHKQHGGKNKHNARARRADEHDLHFIGVDGEGITNGKKHDYVLLSCGDHHLHLDGMRIGTLDIFDFLWSEFLAAPDSVFVGFYLGYDFSQWLRDIPVSRAKALLSKEGIERRKRRIEGLPSFPVDWGDWQFDTLAMRKFRLRRRDPEIRREAEEFHFRYGRWPKRDEAAIDKTPWMTICDAGPFFQTSFLKAIDPKNWRVPIVTKDEFEIIKAGKEGRGADKFGLDMIRYNQLECDVLARIMRDQNEGFTAEGVRLNKTQWFGPGQVAQKWLKMIAAPTGQDVRDVAPIEFRDAARMAYFGGWFEIFWHGAAPGRSYGYDINSAYPKIMSTLPCLLHGSYDAGKGAVPRDTAARDLVLVEASVRGSHPIVGAMLHRRPNGSVMRPRETSGWYWLHELRASKAAGFVDVFHVKQWRRYRPCFCDPPLAPIAALYESRLAVGKNTSVGKTKKLIYNSGYGKFAQSIGSPKYGNPIYASLITSGCRCMILDAIRTHPTGASDLLMVATDGVVFASEHTALDLDDARLGAWSSESHDNLSLFMPGVYWDDRSRSAMSLSGLKSRGISASDLAKRLRVIDGAWRRWKRDGWPKLVIPVAFQLVSPKQALARSKWDLCGSVVTNGQRVISSDPAPKRVGIGPGRSLPYGATPEGRSTPYERTFGDEDLLESEDFGDHPDGPIGAVLMRELIGH